jgi:hypothetical protein
VFFNPLVVGGFVIFIVAVILRQIEKQDEKDSQRRHLFARGAAGFGIALVIIGLALPAVT